MKNKYILIAIFLFIIILQPASFVLAQTADNSALIAQLKAEIADLSAQLDKLEVQQSETPAIPVMPTTSTATWCYNFTKNLNNGFKDAEVTALQEALIKENLFFIKTTGYFGDITKQAVIKFQEKYTKDILTPYGLVNGTGVVGPSTIKKLNNLYSCKIN
jgi:peptidoglycan hydrolase-like protein with peptidoglycan-binding domain